MCAQIHASLCLYTWRLRTDTYQDIGDPFVKARSHNSSAVPDQKGALSQHKGPSCSYKGPLTQDRLPFCSQRRVFATQRHACSHKGILTHPRSVVFALVTLSSDIHVHLYVCMHVCICAYVCMHVCSNACAMYTCMYVQMNASVGVQTWTIMCTCEEIQVWEFNASVLFMRSYVGIHVRVHASIHRYIYLYRNIEPQEMNWLIRSWKHVCLCVCRCAWMHKCRSTYIFACLYIHTYHIDTCFYIPCITSTLCTHECKPWMHVNPPKHAHNGACVSSQQDNHWEANRGGINPCKIRQALSIHRRLDAFMHTFCRYS
jgi:hypothetical protein